VQDLIPIEYRQQTCHRSRRVTRPRLNVFPKDASGILDGAQNRVLVGIIHSARNSTEPGLQTGAEEFRSSAALSCRVRARRAGGAYMIKPGETREIAPYVFGASGRREVRVSTGKGRMSAPLIRRLDELE